MTHEEKQKALADFLLAQGWELADFLLAQGWELVDVLSVLSVMVASAAHQTGTPTLYLGEAINVMVHALDEFDDLAKGSEA
jgi:hypothetical protein